MSGWLWALVGLGAWLVLAAALALWLGPRLRAIDRRDQGRRSTTADPPPGQVVERHRPG